MADIVTNDGLIFGIILIVSWTGVMTILISRWINQVFRNQAKINKKIEMIMKHLNIEYDKK
jgi:hypothetical protein